MVKNIETMLANVMIVTSRIYTRSAFIEEAERIGVNRSISRANLERMRWGDKIFLADFTGKRRGSKVDEATKRRKIAGGELGDLVIFGYFAIDYIAPLCSERLFHEVLQNAEISNVAPVNVSVQRKCGSYVIAGSWTVNEELSSLLKKFEEARKDENIKWFAGGKFFRLDPQITISGTKYFRGVKKMELNVQPPEIEPQKQIYQVTDYRRKERCALCGGTIKGNKHRRDDEKKYYHVSCYYFKTKKSEAIQKIGGGEK